MGKADVRRQCGRNKEGSDWGVGVGGGGHEEKGRRSDCFLQRKKKESSKIRDEEEMGQHGGDKKFLLGH